MNFLPVPASIITADCMKPIPCSQQSETVVLDAQTMKSPIELTANELKMRENDITAS
jgi:hypothetical protein